MKTSFLDFEQPIAELEQKIEELRFVQDDSAVDISQEIERLSKKSRELTKEIYSKLSAWQISKVARHPQRPYTLDYVQMMCTDFEEMHGDRSFADDPAIVATADHIRDRYTHVGDGPFFQSISHTGFGTYLTALALALLALGVLWNPLTKLAEHAAGVR